MTIKELQKYLSEYDQDAAVRVAVRTFTQGYAVAVVDVFAVDRSAGGCALYVQLPEGMYTAERKVRRG
jgi:hypothetical protein